MASFDEQFAQVPKRLIFDTRVDGGMVAVYSVLSSYGGCEEIRLTMEQIQALAGWGYKRVQSALQRLVDIGAVIVGKPEGVAGNRRAYRLNGFNYPVPEFVDGVDVDDSVVQEDSETPVDGVQNFPQGSFKTSVGEDLKFPSGKIREGEGGSQNFPQGSFKTCVREDLKFPSGKVLYIDNDIDNQVDNSSPPSPSSGSGAAAEAEAAVEEKMIPVSDQVQVADQVSVTDEFLVAEDVVPVVKRKPAKYDYEGTPGFVEFWDAYPVPRNDSKVKALAAYRAALERGATVEQLVRAARNYEADPKRREQGGKFTKHSVTFLNQDVWESYQAEPVDLMAEANARLERWRADREAHREWMKGLGINLDWK